MSGWSPPRLRREQALAIVGSFALVALYAVVIARQILPVVLLAVAALGVYLGWRFLRAVEAIADAHQRLADTREADRER